MRQRGFEIVQDRARKHKNSEVILPKRSTKFSAGYDFFAPFSFTIPGKDFVKVYTDVKAYMMEDEVLKIYIRSSLAIKNFITLVNNVGIIDHDYYNNENNDGVIIIPLYNHDYRPMKFESGTKIAQGIFEKYLKTDFDNIENIRNGGIGSTS